MPFRGHGSLDRHGGNVESDELCDPLAAYGLAPSDSNVVFLGISYDNCLD